MIKRSAKEQTMIYKTCI